jgi:hypothetical protein
LKVAGSQQDFRRCSSAAWHHARRVAERLRVHRLGRQQSHHRLPRGMKTNYGDPHRNFVDFAHVPVVRRRRATGVHRSLALGRQENCRCGRPARHPSPPPRASSPAPTWCWSTSSPRLEEALCDGPQALLLPELAHFLADAALVRKCYLDRVKQKS